MKLGTLFGALAGSAIDRADGDDSAVDGALIGAGVVTAVRIIAPIAITLATGWLVLRGLSALTDRVLGAHDPEY